MSFYTLPQLRVVLSYKLTKLIYKVYDRFCIHHLKPCEVSRVLQDVCAGVRQMVVLAVRLRLPAPLALNDLI